MDRCEELAAGYGMSPLDVMRWPWVKLEALWQSCAKRQRREVKMRAMAQGHDIYGVGDTEHGVTDAPRGTPVLPGTKAAQGIDPASITATLRQLDTWPDQPFSLGKPQTYYQPPGVNERAPTDADNWDIPEPEVNALAMWQPGMVQVVKRHPTE